VSFGEIIQLRTLEVQHPDDFALVDHRYGQFGARLGIDHEVARIRRNVGHHDGLAKGRRCAYNAFACGHAQLALHTLAVFHVQAMAKDLLLFVEQHQAQNLVIDYALDQFGGAAQHRFDVQNRADFAADLVENQQRFRLRTDLLE
jgi:hypothetical protein